MAGFRTAGFRKSLPSSIAGARATLTIPSGGYSTLNSAGNALYFFFNLCTTDGSGNIDVGIYKQNNLWYAFSSGNTSPSWQAESLGNMDGKTLNLKAIVKKVNSTTYELELYSGSEKILTTTDSGNALSNIYNKTIAQATAEINIVPKDEIWRYLNTENGYGQSYIKGAAFSSFYPITTTGTDNTGGTYELVTNCDENNGAYDQYVSKVCVINSSTTRSFKSTVDINKAGKVFWVG